MADFKKLVKEIFVNEGGFNHCDPSDSGGCTNWGISHNVYSSWKGRQTTYSEIKNMPKSDAEKIYKERYWDTIGGDRLHSNAIALVLFDQGVNRGVSASVKQAQRLLGLSATGYINDEFINRLNLEDSSSFVTKFLNKSREEYRAIAKRKYSSWSGFGLNSDGDKWLGVWLRRVDRLLSETDYMIKMGHDKVSSGSGSSSSSSFNMNYIYYALGGLTFLGLGYYILTMDSPAQLASNPRRK
jgi:lysozyme family protein